MHLTTLGIAVAREHFPRTTIRVPLHFSLIRAFVRQWLIVT